MKKILSICVSVVAVIAVTADVAWAQDVFKPRRKGFFESLFGVRAKPRKQFNARAWWEDDQDSNVRIIRRPSNPNKPKKAKRALAFKQPLNDVSNKKKPAVKTAYIDPEIEQGLGMGNIPYVPVKLAAVYDPSFSKLITIDTQNSAIRSVLADKSTVVRAPDQASKAVLEHYRTTGFSPIWTKDGKISERGLGLLMVLASANEEGLESGRYMPHGLDSFNVTENQFADDLLGLAQFDVSLTAAAVTYAMHQSGGAYEPAMLSAYHDIRVEAASPNVALRVLAYSPFPSEYLKSLAPDHPAYAVMKTELATTLAQAVTPDVMAEGKRVRIGQKDERVIALRQMLLQQGFLGAASAEVALDKEDLLDKALAKALKAFQDAKGIPQTSNLDTATIRAINGPDLTERREILLTNMERLRWLPKQLGNRHVFVNQASYKVDVFEKNQLIWESNVIVGKPLNQTNVFSDTMETVVFNPSWGVPQSILLNEYLPKLRRNSSYLDKLGFKVLNDKGKVVKSSSINWNSVGSGSAIGIQQPPGDSNALGELKFLFPNKHSIYMHDTPNRHLFAESKRNFSHGCVRVEDPRQFASVLLGWDRARVDSEVDSKVSTPVNIANRPKVHLTYFTAWPDKNGKLQYFSDAYGRDSTLKAARSTVRKSLGLQDGQRLVQNN